MHAQHDLIAFYRHVLRSGDSALAARLGRVLARDPRYRDRALAEIDGLMASLDLPGEDRSP